MNEDLKINRKFKSLMEIDDEIYKILHQIYKISSNFKTIFKFSDIKTNNAEPCSIYY